ncbi:MAG: prolyl oligopeptidase family serine peptidase [Synechococcaceae cyanobacterium SM2_3_1]|nr:prolyl oligopeptidase family serine peptidase [Synechococcaceae cyanobacterium SM2_3_1]
MSRSCFRKFWLSTATLALFCLGCSTPSPIAIDTARENASTSLFTSTGAVPPQGGQRRELIHDGRVRTYYLYTPSTFDFSRPLPLVIALHGGGGTGERFANTTAYDAVAEAEEFIVVYPDGVNERWNDGRDNTDTSVDDVSFIAALIQELSSIRSIEPDQVYVTGISNGGFMTARLACDRPDLFAGYAIVAASLPDNIEDTCDVQNPGSILVIHGTADRFIPYGGGEDPGGNAILSVPQATQFWAEANGCNISGRTRWLPNTDRLDRTVVAETNYGGCRQNALQLMTLWGGGHTWPGGLDQPRWLVGVTSQEVNGSQVIWDFFQSR